MKRIKHTQAILVSSKPEDSDFVKEVCRLANLEFVYFESGVLAAPYLARLKRRDQCLLFIDVSTTESLIEFNQNCSSAIGIQSEKIHPNQVSLLVDAPLAPLFQQALTRNKNYGSLLFRRSSAMIEAAQYYCDILKVITDDRSMGGAEVFVLGHVSEKNKVLGLIDALLAKQTKMHERMIRAIISAVDELILNAFLDAREDGSSDGSKENQSREAVEVCVRRGLGNVSITVIDYHGAFDRFKALGKILPGKGAFGKSLNPNTEGHRAGVGLALTLNFGASLSVVVQPKLRTEVTVSYQETANFRDFKTQFQAVSIHN